MTSATCTPTASRSPWSCPATNSRMPASFPWSGGTTGSLCWFLWSRSGSADSHLRQASERGGSPVCDALGIWVSGPPRHQRRDPGPRERGGDRRRRHQSGGNRSSHQIRWGVLYMKGAKHAGKNIFFKKQKRPVNAGVSG